MENFSKFKSLLTDILYDSVRLASVDHLSEVENVEVELLVNENGSFKFYYREMMKVSSLVLNLFYLFVRPLRIWVTSKVWGIG